MAEDRESGVSEVVAAGDLDDLLVTAQRLAKLGSWSWHPSQPGTWSDEMYRILDRPAGLPAVTVAELIEWVR
ncbi:MAG: hypothetical protein ABIR32_16680, partial [Ilumatobacteraceae bacterium]